MPVRPFISKLVRSMMESPSTRICGSTPSTRQMEMRVPRPRQVPMAQMTGLVVSMLMRIPADARMEPEVKMVGKELFSASTMACLGGIVCFNSE